MITNTTQKAYRISDFLAAYGIGRTLFYKEVKAGRLKIVKVGKISLVTVEAAEKWIEHHSRSSSDV